MSAQRDGGPAWPCEHTNKALQDELIKAREGGASLSFFDIRKLTDKHPGMTLRDYAAIHADIAKVDFPDLETVAGYVGVPVPDDYLGMLRMANKAQAKLRYEMADAMIEAREVRS